ncbi:heme ABC transporter ATP-binding protein [Sporosarcina pasteurii]|uniref:Iron(3+)-hydroxamate import ATP-binding protein FhuC n=1 Tax=Sporosarcina pasteurii TaxID=1474 RepID=A0A380BEA0_SPOPA|nr:heme ABC transporter ATP-binding protein [Sporosarcina pasteurii]MDS9472317.1 heme ABC transporter ATP-binding protein [Sporosarcina pasteurii]QBQ06296.1 heme ABC transporter ATP-binding protein [Sporosarcina pasteurii]SUI99061.1 Iron(3+)-hydroxamate import ATP-binding protein FhuC [Sporosarcina pasteurii]
MLQVNQLSGGYDEKQVVKSVSFHVDKGEIVGILGPNGSGKSTLLKLISGILPATSGTVKVDGKLTSNYSQKEFARKVAVLPQLHAHAFSHTVRETVELGRYPHQSGFFSAWSEDDERAVQEAMKSTTITRYEHQSIELLSGGEQQRVFVAQALAQEAPILLLDEPTNHLDIAHQQQLLDTIRTQAVEKGLTVISVFHDINLASLYCDRLVLMDDGEIAHIGLPQDVVKEEAIDTVYQARVTTQPHPERPKPQITMLPTLTGEFSTLKITKDNFIISSEQVVLQSTTALKTLSSAVHNAGMGWYRTFVNRRVDKNYNVDDVQNEMEMYLQSQHFSLTETVGMMTAAKTEFVEIESYEGDFGTVLVAVTAGLGNAVDVSEVYHRDEDKAVGTINTWVIVNGCLSDEAFIQALMTATEAKAKALQVEEVQDPVSKTIATGTSTDSLLIAATQEGETLPYAGPITPLGKLIAKGVFECTVRAIRAYKKEKGVSM